MKAELTMAATEFLDEKFQEYNKDPSKNLIIAISTFLYQGWHGGSIRIKVELTPKNKLKLVKFTEIGKYKGTSIMIENDLINTFKNESEIKIDVNGWRYFKQLYLENEFHLLERLNGTMPGYGACSL